MSTGLILDLKITDQLRKMMTSDKLDRWWEEAFVV